jgi:hypothetical protein
VLLSYVSCCGEDKDGSCPHYNPAVSNRGETTCISQCAFNERVVGDQEANDHVGVVYLGYYVLEVCPGGSAYLVGGGGGQTVERLV